MTPGIQLLIAILCLVVQAFFAGIETGIISIHRLRLRHFVRQELPGAATLQLLLDSPDRLLGTTLVGTNISMVTLSIVAASLAESQCWGRTAETGVSILVGLIVLVFGEYLPKAWFHSRPIERCRRFASLLRFWERALLPISSTVVWITRLMVPGPSRSFSRPAPFVTKEDLKILAREGEKDGVLSPRERFMIHRVFELSVKKASQIMVPRARMTIVYSDTTVERFFRVARESGLTRMPVYDREKKSFLGIINVFFLISARSVDLKAPVAGFARRPLFVSEQTPVDDILPRLRRSRQPMCLVRNAESEVTGLITTEDILEEIVGKL